MVSSERLFKRIDDMEPEYVKMLEEFCLKPSASLLMQRLKLLLS